ncbi:hypothetical protein B0H12DRAFT_436959 [Mycena haematopus]|nr:hypothetical protein B0H12DRAFT_436959 [Mycena haematopus]
MELKPCRALVPWRSVSPTLLRTPPSLTPASSTYPSKSYAPHRRLESRKLLLFRSCRCLISLTVLHLICVYTSVLDWKIYRLSRGRTTAVVQAKDDALAGFGGCCATTCTRLYQLSGRIYQAEAGA